MKRDIFTLTKRGRRALFAFTQTTDEAIALAKIREFPVADLPALLLRLPNCSRGTVRNVLSVAWPEQYKRVDEVRKAIAEKAGDRKALLAERAMALKDAPCA